MQFLTAKAVLYIRVLYLLAITYTLGFDPEYLGTIGIVVLLGQAMRVPLVFLEKANPLNGVLAFAFAMLALADLVPLLSENLAYFETIVPIRTFVFFAVGAYCYLVESVISNSLVFTYVFFEIWLNFLIYNNLRDEKYYRFKKFMEENPNAFEEAAGERVTVSKEE
ncbi:hypothetical protein DICA3_D15632 [Diutina catenulata]